MLQQFTEKKKHSFGSSFLEIVYKEQAEMSYLFMNTNKGREGNTVPVISACEKFKSQSVSRKLRLLAQTVASIVPVENLL